MQTRANNIGSRRLTVSLFPSNNEIRFIPTTSLSDLVRMSGLTRVRTLYILNVKPQLCVQVPDLKFNISRLRFLLQDLESKKPIDTFPNSGTGFGWSLTSTKNKPCFATSKIDPQEAAKVPLNEIVYPTLHLSEYAKLILLELAKKNFFVARVRVLALGPKSKMSFHVDEAQAANTPTWRLHIPLKTNTKAKLQWKVNGKLHERHLPASGNAFLINVSEMHRAVNLSAQQTRYHLVMSLLNKVDV